MEIRPIKTESDYEAALEAIGPLWGAPEGTEEGDRLDVFLVLVESYESKHDPIEPPDPLESIKFRMNQRKLTRKDLEPLIGSRGRVSAVLNRRHSLSLPMIRRLHSPLQIPLENLIHESEGQG